MYRFAKLSGKTEAARLVTQCGYFGEVSAADLAGVDVYGMVSDDLELGACVAIVRMGAQAYLDYLCVRSELNGAGLAVRLLQRVRQDLVKHKVRVVHTAVHGENAAAAKILLSHNGRSVSFPYYHGTIRLEDDHG